MESREPEIRQWILDRHGEGYSWEELERLGTPSEKTSEVLGSVNAKEKIIPWNIGSSDWQKMIAREKRAHSAIVLVAIFDRDIQQQQQIRNWLTHYAMYRETDFERMWFTGPDSLNKIEKYAGAFHIALVSLDDLSGQSIGQKIYDTNPDCLICYYRKSPCKLEQLLNSRPYNYFSWLDGEKSLLTMLDNMIERVVFSSNVFCLDTKKLLYCYPIRNIQYFQSDLKHIHIKTVVGNDAIVYAKMSQILDSLAVQKLQAHFLQIHKSFVVNRSAIRQLNKQEHMIVLSTGEKIPISDAYYKETIKSIQNSFIMNNE